MRSDDKGKFQSEISQDVIDAAMKSVDKAKAAVQGVEVPIEAPPAPEAPPAAEAAPEAAEAPAAPADPREKEIEELKATLEMSLARGRDLMGKIREEHEKMLRAAADLENYKKRAQKEKEEVQKFGNEKLLKELLPVVDNIDRALESTADLDSLKKGVEMVRRSFADALGKHGVRAFSAKGQPFDPMRHEAISQAETTDMPPNHVFLEQLRGYTLNDRLVRPALVVVSRAPAAPQPAPAAPEAPAGPLTEGDEPKT